MMKKLWKKGRGKLGFLQPLLGSWSVDADSPRGRLRCTRTFTKILNDSRIQLDVLWQFGDSPEKGEEGSLNKREGYQELAIIGVGEEGKVCFWSFTSDGKQSQGIVAEVTDLHPEAVGFEAQMPAGLARMAYWPEGEGGFSWVVESKTQKGWNRFVEHRYRRVE